MSLVFKADGVSETKNYINKSNSNLISAKNILTTIDVPSDFSFAFYLRNISCDIDKLENRNKKINNWIDNTISKFIKEEKKAINFSCKINELFNVRIKNSKLSSDLKINNIKNNTASLNTRALVSSNYSGLIKYSNDSGSNTGERIKSIFGISNENLNDLKKTSANTSNKIKNAFNDTFNWLFNKAVPTVGNVLVNTASTICEATSSIIEGACTIVEGVSKGVVLVGEFATGAVSSIFTAGYDLINGNDFESTKALWNSIGESTKKITTKKYVKNAFNSFYENTGIGKAIDERSYLKHDSKVASYISTGAETIGMIGISVLCPPVGIAVAGLKGAGEGAGAAFDNGASYWGALSYGTARGVMDAVVQNFIGKGGDILAEKVIGKFGQKFLTSTGGKITTKFVKAIFSGTADGTTAFIDPIAQFTYMNNRVFKKGTSLNNFQITEDGTQIITNGGIISMYSTDEFGNKIQQFVIKENNIIEFLVDAKVENKLNYSDLFNLNGGWENVKSQVLQGIAQSLIFDALSRPMANIQQKLLNTTFVQKMNSLFGKKSIDIKDNSSNLDYSTTYDYWQKQIDIKKKECDDLLKIINSEDYKIAMENGDSGYAQGFAQLDYYAEITKKYNDNINEINQILEFLKEINPYDIVEDVENEKTDHMVNSIKQEDLNSLYDVIKKHDGKYGTGTTIERLKLIVDPNSKYYMNYSLITNTGGARDIISKFSPEQIVLLLKNSNLKVNISSNAQLTETHSFFENSQGDYGVDQAAIEKLAIYRLDGHDYSYRKAKKIINKAKNDGLSIPVFEKLVTPEYFELKNSLINKGFSKSDASIILTSINDAGACSYACACNEMFYLFRNSPDLFEKKFGYPMYLNVNGEKKLNSTKLLLDMYVFANDSANGGCFFENGKINSEALSNTIDFSGRQILQSDKQVYMSNSKETNKTVLDKFLKSKSPDFEFDTDVFIDNFQYSVSYSNEMIVGIREALEQEIKNGKAVAMGIYYRPGTEDKVINMISCDEGKYASVSTADWSESFGHAVTVTGSNEIGFYVSSWGRQYIIPYNDLFRGGKCIITTEAIKMNVGGEL